MSAYVTWLMTLLFAAIVALLWRERAERIIRERNRKALPKGAPRVGRSRYSEGGGVHFSHHAGNEIAMAVFDANGTRHYTATVPTPKGAEHPGRYGVWLRTWGENEGVPHALRHAGLVHLTGLVHHDGFLIVRHAELTAKAIAAMHRELGDGVDPQQRMHA